MADAKARARAGPPAGEAAPAEAGYADADPRNPGEAANRAASLAAQREAERRAAPAAGHAARDAAEQAAPPAAYTAVEPLFIGDPDDPWTAKIRAFNPGDQVAPGDVWRHGWREQVRPPEGYEPAPADSAKKE